MSDTPVFKHPILKRLFADRTSESSLVEMIRRVSEISEQGEIYAHEGTFLKTWLENALKENPLQVGAWPRDILLLRLSEWLIQKRSDVSGPYELVDAVMDLGELEISTADEIQKRIDGIPFTSPPPQIQFTGKIFCFIGRFVHGSRKECQWETNARDGIIASRPSPTTDYIVLGSILRKNWGHTRMAREIQAAVNLSLSEKRVNFISEERWIEAL